jgi:Tfp pilus assembly protein PilF/TolB-like protein
MIDFLHFLSGEVPGGILLLFFIALVVNLASFYLYKSSKLFSKEVYKRKAIRYNIFIFSIYIILWIFLEPPKLPERIIILPFQNEESADYRLSEALQRQLYGNLEKEYILHRWEWFYKTACEDSLQFDHYRINLARKIGAAFIITGKVESTNHGLEVNLKVIDAGSVKKTSLKVPTYGQASLKIFDWLRRNIQIINRTALNSDPLSDQYLSAYIETKIALLQGDYERVLKIYNTPDSIQVALVTAAYLQKGISEIENQSDSPLDGVQMNGNFRRLLNLIIPYSKEGKDTADLNIILARMYMHHENYGMAEVCLEKALTQERYNPRIYHYMSFLHESRYNERGFSNRAAVLELAVQLDPGYSSAVYELAGELYTTGTAAPTNPNTIKSIEILRNFVVLNPKNEKILALLGKILLQTKYTLEAMEIYTKLIVLTPNSAEIHYNLGICYLHKKEYEKAKEKFNRSIEISDYPDAYLYLGAINRFEGDIDQALYYYRERVKRKQGDDDQYAKEAMRGIRLILNEIAEKEEEAKTGGNPQ